ncbi:unnamed protein product [Trifolium pratense]|uniref:Uncharacterized protein n=1 Tax=Trifolium pratense TaxID=57577 RepID=A0ACB0L395_TRIPR|nr:unnamed protein product [Trifolium pratense]
MIFGCLSEIGERENKKSVKLSPLPLLLTRLKKRNKSATSLPTLLTLHAATTTTIAFNPFSSQPQINPKSTMQCTS